MSRQNSRDDAHKRARPRKGVKKRGKRLVGALALAAGTLGAALFLRRGTARKEKTGSPVYHDDEASRWARPGMSVTFRAEIMPGRNRDERTFQVEEVLPSNRVRLQGFAGEHTESEFEPLRFERSVSAKPL